MSNQQLSATCPWCNLDVIIPPGGWAYRRSQAVLHLADCSNKPAECSAAELNQTADRMVESADVR